MAMHPTFSHAAADLRRQSYLAEASEAWRSRPEHEQMHVRPRFHALQRWLERVDGIVSRIVDDFEGAAGSPRTASPHPPARTLTMRAARR